MRNDPLSIVWPWPLYATAYLALGQVLPSGAVIVLASATGLGFAGSPLSMHGPDVVDAQPSSTSWVAAIVGIIADLALIGGALGRFVAWIAALLNTTPTR